MSGGARPNNPFVYRLLDGMTFIRDPLQPHEAAEIMLEFPGDI